MSRTLLPAVLLGLHSPKRRTNNNGKKCRITIQELLSERRNIIHCSYYRKSKFLFLKTERRKGPRSPPVARGPPQAPG